MKYSYVYILSNKRHGTLYIGVTSNLVKRIWEHRQKFVEGFSSKYNLDKLVYYEQFEDINEAIGREKRLKKWLRSWKISMINEINPTWKDLFVDIC